MNRSLNGTASFPEKGWLQDLESAKSLENVTAAHGKFVVAVQRQCLLAPDKTWKLIEGVVVQILNQVLHFAELQQKLRKPVRHSYGFLDSFGSQIHVANDTLNCRAW